MCQNEGTHQIVMSFSPPVVGCLLKKSSQKGGGHRHPRTPPGYAPVITCTFRAHDFKTKNRLSGTPKVL